MGETCLLSLVKLLIFFLKSLRVRELKTVVCVFNWVIVKVEPRLYYLAIELVSMATWLSVGWTIEMTDTLANVFLKIHLSETGIEPGSPLVAKPALYPNIIKGSPVAKQYKCGSTLTVIRIHVYSGIGPFFFKICLSWEIIQPRKEQFNRRCSTVVERPRSRAEVSASISGRVTAKTYKIVLIPSLAWHLKYKCCAGVMPFWPRDDRFHQEWGVQRD